MSSPTWTPASLSPELRHYRECVWRLVDAQYHVSLRKLTDSLAEQALLEGLVEGTKLAVPVECRGLDALLSTPFRYAPYPNGSRFRRAGHTLGVYYAAEDARVAVGETAFYRLLFFAESPDTPWPVNPFEYTGFSVEVSSLHSLDLTEPPFDVNAAVWRHPVKYSRCQEFADFARTYDAELLRYWSARSLEGGVCVAVLTCAAFAETQPRDYETWRIGVSRTGAYAIREFPPDRIEFDRNYFGSDPRIAAMRWDRYP
jgi:RES domain